MFILELFLVIIILLCAAGAVQTIVNGESVWLSVAQCILLGLVSFNYCDCDTSSQGN
jgi:hypothetical protein